MRVVITGSRGRVATQLVPRLAGQFELTLLDRQAADEGGFRHQAVDVCDTAALAQACAGAQGIVHLAGNPAVSASWEDLEGPNVRGLVSTFEAARLAGVGKLVFASTNHVTGMYDREESWPGAADPPIRPDSLYGATKAFGEAVGRYYSDVFGMSVVCIRIGWVLEKPHNEHARQLWLSPDDLTGLVAGALRSDVRFGIYYGISDNRQRHWPIDNARAELGYEPADDSEAYFPSAAEAAR